jgi:hypothetical protein
MAAWSVSFDDGNDEELSVFSGYDLLIAHYDVADLDWREVAERSALDQRRGLVITQAAVLEDLIDEFILYLADPIDVDEYQAELDRLTIGPRLDRLEKLLAAVNMFDADASVALEGVRRVAIRRNELAHGTIHCRPVEPVELGGWLDGIPLEWIIISRRSRTIESITCFSSMLQYAEQFVEAALPPRNYGGGRYLATPTL